MLILDSQFSGRTCNHATSISSQIILYAHSFNLPILVYNKTIELRNEWIGYDFTWLCLTISRLSHDFRMTFLCTCINYFWILLDFCMTFIQLLHDFDFHMTFARLSYDFYMTYAWLMLDFCIIFQFNLHDFHMTFAWSLHDFWVTFCKRNAFIYSTRFHRT